MRRSRKARSDRHVCVPLSAAACCSSTVAAAPSCMFALPVIAVSVRRSTCTRSWTSAGRPPSPAALVQLARDFSAAGRDARRLAPSRSTSADWRPDWPSAHDRRRAAPHGGRCRAARAHCRRRDLDCGHSARSGARRAHGGAARRGSGALAPLPLSCCRRSGFGLQAQQLRAPIAKPSARAQSLEPTAQLPLGSSHARRFGGAAVSRLSARLGQDGLRWQRWARGEEMRPAGAGSAGRALRGIARSRVASRRARAVVVRARAAVRAAVRSSRARRIAAWSRCTSA